MLKNCACRLRSRRMSTSYASFLLLAKRPMSVVRSQMKSARSSVEDKKSSDIYNYEANYVDIKNDDNNNSSSSTSSSSTKSLGIVYEGMFAKNLKFLKRFSVTSSFLCTTLLVSDDIMFLATSIRRITFPINFSSDL